MDYSLNHINSSACVYSVSGGRRGHLTLNSILQFITGAEEEPILGFTIKPSLQFVPVQQSFLPTANTCINALTLPRPTALHQLPTAAQLFSLYDLAFSNSYFGNV